MVGQSGAALTVVRHETGAATIRHSTVQCGLRRALKQCHHGLLPLFQRASHTVGIYMHVVGLVANDICIRDPTHAIASWKTFYDQVFSAVEGADNRWRHQVDAFRAANRFELPAKVHFEMRQNECLEMATSAVMHLRRFRSRLSTYLRHRFVRLQMEQYGRVRCDGGGVMHLVGRCATAPAQDLDACQHSLKDLLCKERCSELYEVAERLVHKERDALGDLVEQRWFQMKDVPERHLHRFLPHLQRYSIWNLEWAEWRAQHPQAWTCKTTPTSFSLLPLFRLQPRHVHYTWSAFDGFVSWCKGQLQQDGAAELLDDVQQEHRLKAVAYPSKRVPKRPLDQEGKGARDLARRFIDCFRVVLARKYAERWKAYVARRRAQRLRLDLQLQVMSGLFDLTRVKGKCARGKRGTFVTASGHRAPKWRVNSFRTDGVQLCLGFVSGCTSAAPNVADLVKAGYDLAEPIDGPQTVDVCTTQRGVYILAEGRQDIAPCTDPERPLTVVPIDPGHVKVVQAAAIPYAECTSVASICAHVARADASVWHITGEAWNRGSGRAAFEAGEAAVRTKAPAYGRAVEALRGTIKKCALASGFEAYCRVAFEHFDALVGHLVSLDRSKIRWAQTRRTVSWLAHAADRVFDRTSLRDRPQMTTVGGQAVGCARPLAPAPSCDRLRQHLAVKAARRADGSKRIALMGDGTFGPSKRHAPVPKKNLVKQLATRGLTVLLDEYNTSKMCPCGASELVDRADASASADCRPRCHKTVGLDGPCCVERAMGPQQMDRDVLALVNFTWCFRRALSGLPRPINLCGPWRARS